MIALVYQKGTNMIIHRIEDVQYINNSPDVEIVGKSGFLRGIDITLASFCIVNETALQTGDILGNFTDTRASLPPNSEERLTALEDALLSMMGL